MGNCVSKWIVRATWVGMVVEQATLEALVPLPQVGQTEAGGIWFTLGTVNTSDCFLQLSPWIPRDSSIHQKRSLISMPPSKSSLELISDSSGWYIARRFCDSHRLHLLLPLLVHQTIGSQHVPAVGFEIFGRLPILCLVFHSSCQVWHDLWRICVRH